MAQISSAVKTVGRPRRQAGNGERL